MSGTPRDAGTEATRTQKSAERQSKKGERNLWKREQQVKPIKSKTQLETEEGDWKMAWMTL